MKRFTIMVALAAFLTAGLVNITLPALACDGAVQGQTALRTVSLEEMQGLLAKGGAMVIDARSAESFAKNHIQGAVNIPLARISDSTLPSNKATPLVFYCGGPMCTLAEESAAKALEAGYTNVAVFKDGIQGWMKAGGRVS